MQDTAIGIGLVVIGSISVIAGVLYGLNPPWLSGRKAAATTSDAEAPALSTVVQAPQPMWLGEPIALASAREETVEELFAELFSLRSMVGDLAREVRLLKSQLAATSDEASVPTAIRRVA